MGRGLTPLAVVLVVAAVIIIVTSGESIAVRYLVGPVSLDVAVRLIRWERGQQRPGALPVTFTTDQRRRSGQARKVM